MKKILFTTIITLAALTARAQATPEALIGQCPSMPSVAVLAAAYGNDDAALARVEEFSGQIRRLQEKCRQESERGVEAAAMSDAERIAKQQTGHSIAELENMSEAQLLAAANQMAGKKIAAAGLGNMSLSDLQALEGKSDEEIMKAFTGGTALGGLTPEELKAMENMTDKQAEAYLQQGDRMQRIQAAADSPQAKARMAEAGQQAAKAKSQTDIAAAMKKITDRWAEIDRLNNKEMEDVVLQIDAVCKRYDAQIKAVPRSALLHGHVDIYSESEERTVRNLSSARDSECFTLWSNQISKMQGRLKTKLADVPEYDALLKQQMAGGGMTATAKVMPSMGLDIAAQYLSTTAGVTSYPIIIGD